jgi:hypothetical protein
VTSLLSLPRSTWRGLPKTSKLASRLKRKFYFTGKPCRNGHIAPAKVRYGCIVCIGLAKARADIKINERMAQRELENRGAVRPPLTTKTAVGQVLVAIAERGGIFTRDELVDTSVRGMSRSIVNRAVSSLLGSKLVQHDRRVYRVTLAGYGTAMRLGASPAKFG